MLNSNLFYPDAGVVGAKKGLNASTSKTKNLQKKASPSKPVSLDESVAIASQDSDNSESYDTARENRSNSESVGNGPLL